MQISRFPMVYKRIVWEDISLYLWLLRGKFQAAPISISQKDRKCSLPLQGSKGLAFDY